MSTPKETSDVALGSHGSSEQSSTAPESDKQTNVHAERYYKLHKFFGFTKGYNFPLCKPTPSLPSLSASHKPFYVYRFWWPLF